MGRPVPRAFAPRPHMLTGSYLLLPLAAVPISSFPLHVGRPQEIQQGSVAACRP